LKSPNTGGITREDSLISHSLALSFVSSPLNEGRDAEGTELLGVDSSAIALVKTSGS
jgi:hypothetical protein